jgi:hypothetical protein
MTGKKIGVSELKDIEILYKGDIYELACLILKLYDAKNAGTNTRSRDTVYGLAGEYAMLLRWSRERVLAILAPHNLPLEATVEYDV